MLPVEVVPSIAQDVNGVAERDGVLVAELRSRATLTLTLVQINGEAMRASTLTASQAQGHDPLASEFQRWACLAVFEGWKHDRYLHK